MNAHGPGPPQEGSPKQTDREHVYAEFQGHRLYVG